MADWLKSIQSAGRGFRPGMEVHTIIDGKDTGKTIVFDIESDDFKYWREIMRPHYAEYRDHKTGETYWKKFNRLPKNMDSLRANTVIRKNEDGSYEYVKNRETGELRKLTEEEISWLILKV